MVNLGREIACSPSTYIVQGVLKKEDKKLLNFSLLKDPYTE